MGRMDSRAGTGGRACADRGGLLLLMEAFGAAARSLGDPWGASVDLQELRSAGLTSSDLRWLICRGYTLQAREDARACGDRRSFRVTANLGLAARARFILSASGAEFVAGLIRPGPPRGDGSGPVPAWDRSRRELALGGLAVKRYRQPSPNQEAVLDAFEEGGWPGLIDDPIPPRGGEDPRQRLRDTVKHLNKFQIHRLIYFSCAGHGESVRWGPPACGPGVRALLPQGSPTGAPKAAPRIASTAGGPGPIVSGRPGRAGDEEGGGR
jgi:hypothetical protein